MYRYERVLICHGFYGAAWSCGATGLPRSLSSSRHDEISAGLIFGWGSCKKNVTALFQMHE
jgi:hypothetical protein